MSELLQLLNFMKKRVMSELLQLLNFMKKE